MIEAIAITVAAALVGGFIGRRNAGCNGHHFVPKGDAPLTERRREVLGGRIYTHNKPIHGNVRARIAKGSNEEIDVQRAITHTCEDCNESKKEWRTVTTVNADG